MSEHGEIEDHPPALEDAEVDDADIDEDCSSDASIITDTSDSVSVDSDALEAPVLATHPKGGGCTCMADGEVVIHRFNKLMGQGIEECDEEEEEEEEEDEIVDDALDPEEELTGDYKRRRGVLENPPEEFSVTLEEPVIVPLKTGCDEDFVKESVEKPNGRRLGTHREEALQRNMIRRQSSNEMLQAMQSATRDHSTERQNDAYSSRAVPCRKPPSRTKSGGEFQRRPPPRTKSGERVTEVSFQRKPPARTKSGEGQKPFARRAPATTKSSGIISSDVGLSRDSLSSQQNTRKQRQTISAVSCIDEIDTEDLVPSEVHCDDDASLLTSPSGRRRGIDKEMALKRNAARRQKSSDMLGAMRDATRNAPARSKSSAASFDNRPPRRNTSGAALLDEKDNGLEALSLPLADDSRARRPPPRTKSGDGMRRLNKSLLEQVDG